MSVLAGRSDYVVGVALLVVSAVAFSTAGLFTKGVAAGAWDVIFWRGLFAAMCTAAWTVRGRAVRRNFVGMGAAGWAIAVIGASGTAAFIPAFKLTSIANVSLIYAVAPLIAALLGWLAIRERVSLRVILGSAAALAGVAIIVSGSIGQSSLQGDVLALWMTVTIAIIMVLYRKYPGIPTGGPTTMQSVLLLPVALMFGDPFNVDGFEIFLLAVFGLLFAIAWITMTEGAKLIPAGQTALLATLEIPLALVLAFMLFAEVPTAATVLGGTIVLAAVLLSIRKTDR